MSNTTRRPVPECGGSATSAVRARCGAADRVGVDDRVAVVGRRVVDGAAVDGAAVDGCDAVGLTADASGAAGPGALRGMSPFDPSASRASHRADAGRSDPWPGAFEAPAAVVTPGRVAGAPTCQRPRAPPADRNSVKAARTPSPRRARCEVI